MYPTKNDLPKRTRTDIIALLDRLLADAIDLQTQCKQAHWNVKGPNFIALHELFDKVNEDVEEYVDLIAERAVQLGGAVHGTARMVAKRTRMSEYGERGGEGMGHARALSDTLAQFGALARKDIDAADKLGDADTADILTEISRGTDKWLWFVESHLQAKR